MRRRPEVENLESLTLLSSMVGKAHHAAAALVATPGTPLPNPLHLSGGANGSYQLRGGSDTARINGSGSMGPIGKVRLSGVVTLDGESSGGGNLNVSNRRGRLTLVITSPTAVGEQGFSATYVIVGGTGSLAGETGSGSFVATLRPNGASRGSFRATIV